jgi:hypothetical protein
MENLQQHLTLLGLKVRDRVTGLTGIATSVCFDLYGCIQATVHPGLDTTGRPGEICWYDVARLEVVDNTPVMERPAFDWSPPAVAAGLKGPAEKPAFVKA